MIKALAIKELRESAGLVALAALGMVWALAGLMGVHPLRYLSGYVAPDQAIAFVTDRFATWASIFVGGLAVALGLKQSAWERGRDTYYFLLWRPVSRRVVFGTKIIVGVFLVVALLAVAIGIYGWWASIPGKKPAPFEWSMTVGAWKQVLLLPLIYLGAFLSGLRPGRWFGTRLIPLAGVFVWVFFASSVPYTWLFIPMLVLGYFGVLVAISYFAETSDF